MIETNYFRVAKNMNNVEMFKHYSSIIPIGCSVNLELENFKDWLEQTPDHQMPHVKYALFFQEELTEDRIQEFVSVIKGKYPDNQIEINKGVTENEMAEIVFFCQTFNNEIVEV